MSMSTLNLLSGLMTPDFLQTAAQATGESEGGVAKALGAAFPVVLAQLAQGAGNSTMMGKVADMARNPAIEALLGPGGGILASVGSMLSPGAASSPVGAIGSSLLSGLFGNNIGGLAGALGSFAGLKNAGSASSLMGLAAPMVLAALGNKLGDGLTGTALSVLLGQEKNGIMSAVPGALSGAMGLLGGAASSAAPVAAAAATVAAAVAAKPGPVMTPPQAAAPATPAPAPVAAAPQPAKVATPAAAPVVAAPTVAASAPKPAAAAAPAPMAAAPQAAKPAAAPVAATHTAAAAPRTVQTTEQTASSGSSIGGSLLGLLLTGAILAGVVFGVNQCAKATAPVAPPAAKKVEAPAPAPVAKAPEAPKPVEKPAVVAAPAPAPKPEPAPVAAPTPAPAAPAVVAKAVSLLASMKPGDGGLFNLALPTGKTISIAEKGVETELIGFLEDKSQPIDKGTWFNFDRLTFKTASTDLTPESKSQVDAVTEILKAFPTAHVKIGGYTDNQGDPAMNLKLSDDRAKRVMAEFVGLGIGADRLSAEGYGDQHAVGDNSTPEGRAKNRRTALSVRQR